MTECYAMVRGSALRATALRSSGDLTEPHRYVVSKSVVKVTIDEVSDGQGQEVLRDDTDRPRLMFKNDGDQIGYVLSADFLRVDPDLLNLMTGVPVVFNAEGDIVGFDANTKIPVTAFAMEVWSKLSNKKWGYTLFPFLRGGYLSGFVFGDGIVSFNLKGAQTRRGSLWFVGPYDLHGLYERLVDHVSGNGSWTTTVLDNPPPEQTDGVVEFEDIIYGGNATTAITTPPDILFGGDADSADPWIVSGGRA